MVNWYHTDGEIGEAYRRQREWARPVVRDHGANPDELLDAHACAEFAQNGGRCAFCGAIVQGSPADVRARDYDTD